MRIHLLTKRIFSYISLALVISASLFFPLKSVYAVVGPLDGSRECLYQGTLQADGQYNSGGGLKDKTTLPACTSIDTGALGFKIPSLGDILTFVIRAFLAIS